MKQWNEYALTEMGTLQRGRSRHRPRYAFHLYGGPYPFIQTGQIRAASKYITSYEQTYSEAGLAQSKLWPVGTLCITIAANIAEVAILTFDACFPDSVLGFTPDKNKCDIDFAYYTLKYYQKELQAHGEGSVQDNINLGTFENIKFPFPTVEKQKQISSILSDLDNKIELLSNQNNTIEELAKVLFQEKFIINVFEEWEEVTLDSVCLKINSGGTPSTKFNEYYKGDINWYSTKELNDNYLFSSTSKLSEKALNESSAKLFPINTVVIAIYAAPTVGRLGILATEAAFNQAACGFVVNEEKICFEYLYLHLLLLRQKLNDMASGTAQQNLNVGLIKNFKILLPPNEIMTSFKELIRPMFQKIKENSEQIIKLTELRDFLIPKLLSQDLITQ